MAVSEKIDLDALPFALGAIGLGVVGIVTRDFALQWQPVPAGVPAHGFFSILSGAILVAGGIATLSRNAGKGRLILPLFYALWVVALHLPRFIAHPGVAALLGLAEVLSLATAGTLLARVGRDAIAIRVFGLCVIVFGISHFAYITVTARMVPTWISPGGIFWAYATGAAHLAAGLAIISDFFRRIAATMIAAMCGLFTLLVWAPPVFLAPHSRTAWTMLLLSMAIAGAAWVVSRAAQDDPRMMRFVSSFGRGPTAPIAGRKAS